MPSSSTPPSVTWFTTRAHPTSASPTQKQDRSGHVTASVTCRHMASRDATSCAAAAAITPGLRSERRSATAFSTGAATSAARNVYVSMTYTHANNRPVLLGKLTAGPYTQTPAQLPCRCTHSESWSITHSHKLRL